jgi:hypothetical protein
MILEGGCLCGRVRYEVKGELFNRTNCHCSICRRTSSAPFVAWFTVNRNHFHWLSGQPAAFESSPGVMRSFCRDCAAPLTFARQDLEGEIDVTTCSLDAPDEVPPEDHVFVARKLAWILLNDGLPQYPGARGASG